MTDKENLAPRVIPETLFFSKSPSSKKNTNKSRYNKNTPQEFIKIENSIVDETETESLSIKRNTRKVSELIRPESKNVKTVHVRKVSDDDIVVYKEDEVQKPENFYTRAKKRLSFLCKCIKR